MTTRDEVVSFSFSKFLLLIVKNKRGKDMKQWVEWVVEYVYRRKEIQEFLGLFFFFFSIQAHRYTSNLALHLDEAMNDLAHIN